MNLRRFSIQIHFISKPTIFSFQIIAYKRASLACAARLAYTLCPPEAPFGRLRSHWLFIREITSQNTSVLLLYNLQARFACLRCAAFGHLVSAESPCGRLELLNLNYFFNFFPLYIYCKQRSTNNFSYGSENMIFEIYTPENPMSTVESKFLAYF